MRHHRIQYGNKAKGTFNLFSLITASAIIICLLSLFSCSPRPETTLERARRTGTIRVGYANDVPFAYVDKAGHLTGEAPEIARKVLAKMGIDRMDGVLVEFAQLIPALKSGRIDMISSMMFITPERCREINFSEPTCGLGQGFIVKAGNPLDLHSYENVAAHPTAVFCAIEGTAEVGYAKNIGIPDSRILLVPDTSSGIHAIIRGNADAFAVAGLTIELLMNKPHEPGIEMARPFTGPMIRGREAKGYGAYGFRKTDGDLLEEFNKHLRGLVGSREHLDIIRPLGFSEEHLPGNITTSELCGDK